MSLVSSCGMNPDELIQKMRARVEQCRRLAEMIHSPDARKTLLQMADEGEADIKKLEANRTTG
jgi:hypothetical protein